MSLEDAINRLADAVNNLAKVPNVTTPGMEEAPRPLISGIAPAEAQTPKRGPGRPPSDNKQPATPATSTQSQVASPPATAPVPASPEAQAAKPLDAQQAADSVYANLRTVTNELAGQPGGKVKAVAVLQSFGVATAKELKPEQWAEAILKMKAAAQPAPAADDGALA